MNVDELINKLKITEDELQNTKEELIKTRQRRFDLLCGWCFQRCKYISLFSKPTKKRNKNEKI